MEVYPVIRRGTFGDLQRITEIIRQYRDELGYVHPRGLRDHIAAETVLVVEWFGNVWGIVEYHARRDGWQTVRHLAVDKHATGEGLGRQLLYAVPCPLRLKVTVDNERANRFYTGAGLQWVGTEPGRKRPLNVYELRRLIVMVKGGVVKAPEQARASGMAYGVRGDYRAYDWPYMMDVDFEGYLSGKTTWADYLERIDHYRPVQAMCVDYGPHQPSREVLYDQICDLRERGVQRVMVCPKFEGAIDHIPAGCIVALSVPSSLAGWLPNDFKVLGGRRVHLLGGSPQMQREIAARVETCGGVVISADGNLHTKAGAYGRVFEHGRWSQTEGQDTNELIVRSGTHITQFLQTVPEQMPMAL